MKKATQRVWEMKHFVRSQLLAQNEEKLVDDLENDDLEKKLLKVIPYTTSGGLTQYAKKLHGEEARKKLRTPKVEEGMTDEQAAVMMQKRARQMLARNR